MGQIFATKLMYLATRLPQHDGEAFIAKMEEGIDEGNTDFLEANMERLEALSKKLKDRAYEIAQLQYRARVVRDRHEPPAENRLKE